MFHQYNIIQTTFFLSRLVILFLISHMSRKCSARCWSCWISWMGLKQLRILRLSWQQIRLVCLSSLSDTPFLLDLTLHPTRAKWYPLCSLCEEVVAWWKRSDGVQVGFGSSLLSQSLLISYRRQRLWCRNQNETNKWSTIINASNRWVTYFANAPDKPVMLVVPFAWWVH